MIEDGSSIITEPSVVASSMNTFFSNVASKIGCDLNPPDFNHLTPSEFVNRSIEYFNSSSHESISEIKNNSFNCSFNFHPIDVGVMVKTLGALDHRKATGCDRIPAKVLSQSRLVISQPLTNIFNSCILYNTFPDLCKLAEIRPIYKKSDPLDKKNYRPVSILTSLSKLFEKLLESQLISFQNKILNPGISAFRSGYSCQSVLLKLTEDIRSSLDQGYTCGLVLMDLSKAFDCIPHHLLISKLHAYGMSTPSLTLIASYLLERKQRVKLRGCVSDWTTITKGVPQGSVLGPMLFNLFLNDIYFANSTAELYNYADDNTICASGVNVETVKKLLCIEATRNISWFKNNLMEANPNKFEFILFGRNVNPVTESLSFSDVTIQCVTEVKLLGVTLDYKLTFSSHINNLASKAGAQLCALNRIKRYLDKDARLTLAKTFILSHFRYCPTIWHFCGKVNANKLENIQKRTLSIALGNFHQDYDSLLCSANLTTLDIIRQKCIILEVFKSIKGINPPYLNNLFNRVKSRHTTRFSVNGVVVPTVKTVNFGKHSIRFYGASLWNGLSPELKGIDNLKYFSSKLACWRGAVCSCALCR